MDKRQLQNCKNCKTAKLQASTAQATSLARFFLPSLELKHCSVAKKLTSSACSPQNNGPLGVK